MSVIPAQITQLPGHNFEYDNNPSAFETVLSGVGAFMNAQAEKNKEAEKRRSTEMAGAFAAMVSKGLVDTGAGPNGTFTYGGSPFHFTDPGDPARGTASKLSPALERFREAKAIGQEKLNTVDPYDALVIKEVMSGVTNQGQNQILGVSDAAAASDNALTQGLALVDKMRKARAKAEEDAMAQDLATKAAEKAKKDKVATRIGLNKQTESSAKSATIIMTNGKSQMRVNKQDLPLFLKKYKGWKAVNGE